MVARESKARLVLLSFLMLFVELTIIRWGGANIYALSYFSNFILLASFLGIGLGFIRPQSKPSLFKYAPILLGMLIYLIAIYGYEYHIQMDMLKDDLDFHSFYFTNNLIPIEITLPFIFIAVTIVMSVLANGVAQAFRLHSALEAYRLEILGSLCGIASFSILSFLHATPFWWGMIISLLFILTRLSTATQLIGMTLMLFGFMQNTTTLNQHWSPYYKIHTLPYSHHRQAVIVNGWPQQFVETVAQRTHYKPFYFKPYAHLPAQATLDNVLVIGAGTGGDVAIALAQGAKHIDAVEIDPALYQLGKKINLDHPYNDPRVSIHIDDGRSFLQQSTSMYNMIIFALPDSLMVLSGLSSLRLENYLFTIDGFKAAYQHLAPNGIFTLYNYYRERWVVDRIGNMLQSVFQHSPCLDTEGQRDHWLSVLTISQSPSYLHCHHVWNIDSPKQYVTPPTDDHPFFYTKENTISAIYLAALLFVLLATLVGTKIVSGNALKVIKGHADLFLMGIAFLLLETKSVTMFALLFGSTWFVNALVFAGILLTIYFAIEATHRFRTIKPSHLYSGLFFSLLMAWIIPLHALLAFSPLLRFVIASALTFSPVFIANLIFSSRFQACSSSTTAFGANLIGAVIGGLLEYASIMVGYQNLLLIAAGLYLLAIMQKCENTAQPA